MDTKAVANKLVKLCKQGKFLEAVDHLYADDIVSIEPADYPDQDRRTAGIANVRRKNEWWIANNELHEMRVDGPFIADDHDQFAVYFYVDVTSKANGQRLQGSEIGLYSVKDGKVVSEQFLHRVAGDSMKDG